MGKRLYKTSMLNVFRLVVLVIVVFFFNGFYLDTFAYEKFQHAARFSIFDVFNYHYQYPGEFIAFVLLILVPAAYYAFIRGVSFHEKGFIFNQGLPFLNKQIPYKEVKTYKLLHPKYAISILTKNGDAYVIADNATERVVAILDQQNIKGDLGQDDYAKLIVNYRKFLYVVLSFTAFLFVLKKLGLFFS